MEATTKTCQCGCGAEVRRRFLPGHDAKLKSRLVANLRSADWRVRTTSADMLADMGWTQHANQAVLRSVVFRTARGLAVQHVDEVSVWQVDGSGMHHSHRGCGRLTAWARQAGAVNPNTKLASDRALQLEPNTPEMAAALRWSWDLCTECTTEATRDELGQASEVQKQRWMAAA